MKTQRGTGLPAPCPVCGEAHRERVCPGVRDVGFVPLSHTDPELAAALRVRQPTPPPAAVSAAKGELAFWTCRIGPEARSALPNNADSPLRRAVRQAFYDLTGHEDGECASGWGKLESIPGPDLLAAADRLRDYAEMVSRVAQVYSGDQVNLRTLVAAYDAARRGGS